MLKAEIIEMLTDLHTFTYGETRERYAARLAKEPKYVLEARLDLLTAPSSTEARQPIVKTLKSAYDRQDRIGRRPMGPKGGRKF